MGQVRDESFQWLQSPRLQKTRCLPSHSYCTHVICTFSSPPAVFPGRPGGLSHLPAPDGRQNWPVFLESARGVSTLLQKTLDALGVVLVIMMSSTGMTAGMA